MAERQGGDRKRLSLELSRERLAHIDALKKEWGLRNRGDVLERLLNDLFTPEDEEDEDAGDSTGLAAPPGSDAAEAEPESRGREDVEVEPDFDDGAALVLVERGSLEQLEAQLEPGPRVGPRRQKSSGGIDLPGFVRQRSQQLRRSLVTPPATDQREARPPMPQVGGELIQQAMDTALQHWQDLYGQPPHAAVLEAAMVWLAQEIWPQADGADGRTFTWTAACRVMGELAPGWSEGPPSFARVMVTAGLLEDPFSAATLPVRIPTLIRRFVHRYRRRRRGTSFQTLQHTMTLHGALKLLQLPTDPGHRLTLRQIRDAYRELAMSHHPDSGGSVEAMRRLNEAYQLLKELYRPKD